MVGTGVAMRAAPDVVSYEVSGWLLLGSAGVGLAVGFAVLGLRQAQALDPYVRGAWWWVGAMAVAWAPMPLAWLGYDAVLSTMVVNIYPDPHGMVKVLAVEVALLTPSLVAFGLIARRERSTSRLASSTQRSNVPPARRKGLAGTLAGLLVPPLLVVTAFAGLVIAQSARVERAWIAQGPADYLSVGPGGQIVTSPAPGTRWDPSIKLSDANHDGSLRAGVAESSVEISATTGTDTSGFKGTLVRSIRVFSGPPPADYYADDIVNIVRFNPDGKLLAVGTGQALEMDSAVNRSYDHAVHVWSLPGGGLLYILSEPKYSVRALAWSPDGHYLAAAGGLENKYGGGVYDADNVIRVWRLSTGHSGENANTPSLTFTFVGHTTSVEALAWRTDSRTLVSRDRSNRVVIWRIP